ncbi:MAG: Gfo/Idh/MocA family oxidoreductase [Candidatus Tectomicrobia bacterium]|nr:Gfo/Idh/MocA family oxidoreductase [Candidatus Tectomicrobia bacterium]
MVDKKLRVGVVGLGRIFDLNSLGYLNNPGAEIVALCDSNSERLARRSQTFPNAFCTTDYERFLEQEPDLIEILTPHPLHAEMAVAAFKKGAHVSVQKPMAMTLDEADRMIAAAEAAGRHLRVFENFLFYPPLVKARELLQSGAIGRPLHFRMKMVAGAPEYGWAVEETTERWRLELFKQGHGGDLVFDDGHHKLAVALWLFGDVRDLYACIETTPIGNGYSVDAPASLMWRHVDPPVHAIWDITYAPKMKIRTDYYACDEHFEITGETGVIHVTRCTGRTLDEPVLTLYRDGEVTAFHNLESDWGESFRLSTEHFVSVLCEGEGRPCLTGAEGRRVLAFSFRLLESSRQGRPLPLSG